jgi:mRNA deadenylase 3'-5' endonuclease subunit Ccr4
MYSPNQPNAISEFETSWEHRSRLLRQQIESANAVVCLQEVSPDSFETDFEFMRELGYLNSEMYKKGRIRPATFWKPSRVTLCGEVSHRDRCLITPFKLHIPITTPPTTTTADDLGEMSPLPSLSLSSAAATVVYVVNVHLSAGPEAERRLRQVVDVCDHIRKTITKQQSLNSAKNSKSNKGKAKTVVVGTTVAEVDMAPPNKNVIVITGDMNADGDEPNGISEILSSGGISTEFREAGLQVTNKPKKQVFEHIYTIMTRS